MQTEQMGAAASDFDPVSPSFMALARAQGYFGDLVAIKRLSLRNGFGLLNKHAESRLLISSTGSGLSLLIVICRVVFMMDGVEKKDALR